MRYKGRLRYIWFVSLGLNGCGIVNHSDDPKSCRERVTKYIVETYPDPANLAKALEIVCPEGAP